MDTKLSYFSKTFPNIWKNVKGNLVEKNGVFFQENDKDEYPKLVFVLYPSLPIKEISLIEDKLNVVFPEEYKNFLLLHHNGMDFFDDPIV